MTGYYRCPYCLRPTQIDPEPGCCGELHAEPIPEDEMDEYTDDDLRNMNAAREYDND